MAARGDVTDLVAWQLANDLRIAALAVSQRPGVARQRRYVRRLANAAASAPSQIADGFERRHEEEFVERVRAARMSEATLLELLVEAQRRGLVSRKELSEYEFLARQAMASATGLIRYLENASARRATTS